MSDYLVQRMKSSPKITLHPFTEITALNGDAILREVTWTNRETGASETRGVGSVFVMIGAEPNTEWLDGCLDLDERGFVVTGHDASGRELGSPFATTAAGIDPRRRPETLTLEELALLATRFAAARSG